VEERWALGGGGVEAVVAVAGGVGDACAEGAVGMVGFRDAEMGGEWGKAWG
jgi:hypothetical protein